jgi:hypothetical protein
MYVYIHMYCIAKKYDIAAKKHDIFANMILLRRNMMFLRRNLSSCTVSVWWLHRFSAVCVHVRVYACMVIMAPLLYCICVCMVIMGPLDTCMYYFAALMWMYVCMYVCMPCIQGCWPAWCMYGTVCMSCDVTGPHPTNKSSLKTDMHMYTYIHMWHHSAACDKARTDRQTDRKYTHIHIHTYIRPYMQQKL